MNEENKILESVHKRLVKQEEQIHKLLNDHWDRVKDGICQLIKNRNLRDDFAMAALTIIPEILKMMDVDTLKIVARNPHEAIAKAIYMQADAILAERSKETK